MLTVSVVQEIMAIRRTSPTLPPDQCLRLAYHNVMEKTGYATRLEQQRETQRRAEESRRMKDRAAAARKSTAVNVRSSPARSSTTPKTMDDTLSEIARKHYG